MQRGAGAASRAYLGARHERAGDPQAVRYRLGLSRKAIEDRAKVHVERAGWMRAHLTKATALHVADEVWQSCDRFLFCDSRGRGHGPPRVGSWWDFTRIPGRARSHTKTQPVWETYRLVGSLQGHLDTYGQRATIAAAGAVESGRSVLAQPNRLPAPAGNRRSWWDYDGPLAVVYTAPTGRIGGVDGNVSNIAVASIDTHGERPGVLTWPVTATPDQQQITVREAKKARDRMRALDRSRRATNASQYRLSPNQQARADRRAAAGLPTRTVDTPAGARVATSAGIPVQAYRKDVVSQAYRDLRADHAAAASATTRRKDAFARQTAQAIIAAHGPHLITEDVDVRTWARR